MVARRVGGEAEAVVDGLWRAYAPYQRGRGSGDLPSMLALLVMAYSVESELRSGPGEPSDAARRWTRALAEASAGAPPLVDLRAVARDIAEQLQLSPLSWPDFEFGGSFGDESDDLAWVTAFLRALRELPLLDGPGLAEVCELLIERHAREGALPSGEFYTPSAVASLLVDMTGVRRGDRILDPACGTGGMLVAAARQLAEEGPVDGDSLEAYAVDRGNLRLAALNLAVHGVERPRVGQSDPVALMQGRGAGYADLVISNPPFNQRTLDSRRVRWPFGPPPDSNANFAWLQLAWSRLSEQGQAAMVMPPSASWVGGSEGAIRRDMIARGAVLGIVALPPNLFLNTTTAVHVWLLARDRAHHPVGSDGVIFVDAGRLGTQHPRQPRTLSEEETRRIVDRVGTWLRNGGRGDEPGFSRVVAHADVIGNAGNLDPRLYVRSGSGEVEGAGGLGDRLAQLEREERAMSSAELRWIFDTQSEAADRSAAPVAVPLRTVVRQAGSSWSPVREGLLAGPSGSLLHAHDYVAEGGVPVVMPRDLTDNGFVPSGIKCVSAEKAEQLARFRLAPGDVVVARRGELGRCAVVREEQAGWVCGTGCFVVTPSEAVTSDYLAAFLRSAEARAWLAERSTGSIGLQTVSLKVLGDLPVVVPDREVQQAITDFTVRLDEHEQLMRKQLELLRSIRSGAVRGFLAD
ncbi:N-6 DNA methylase [Kitasatospora sp. NPDC088134]|uniref:N-6 DNA methylase n=1 Tax=Kitasatospora sp. NPDC088134 TaxID=3364071 RepID=UPI0037FF0DD0